MDAEIKTAVLQLMQTGTLEVEGLLPWSSNYAFLVRLCGPEGEVPAVYKPRRGERPLWDFADGTLCSRERAAFLVSEALGWDLVPPTVLREGEHGIGSVQLFIDHDPERHYLTFEGDKTFRKQLQQMVLLDVIMNNADRKAGHVLIGRPDPALGQKQERIWGIDHGICFHTDHKLRTVIWEFAGKPIPEAMVVSLQELATAVAQPDNALRQDLLALLTRREVDVFQIRIERLLQNGVFPVPGPGRHYPWPPV